MPDYRLFPTNPTPSVADAGYSSGITVGVRFRITSTATATQVWFYKPPANTGTHIGAIWNQAGVLQQQVTFTGETASGWQSATFATPITLTIGEYYTAGVFLPVGHFPRTAIVHASSITNGPLYAPSNAESTPQPCYATGGSLTRPTSWESTDSYGVDVTVTVSDVEPPTTITRAMVRGGVLEVTFAGNLLADVIGARGTISADRGWPLCSVFVTAKPVVGNEEDDISVTAGTSNVIERFTGKVRRFRPNAFPKSIEMLAMGTLAYAAEWAPDEEIWFDEVFPSGATDQAIVQWALDFVPGVTYTAGNIGGTGITLGVAAPEAFNWAPGTSAWSYIQQIDRATLYRTYQTHDGTIYRVQMIGHPSSNPEDFTLTNEDVLDGSSASRNTEQTRNAARVVGHDYGDGAGPVLGIALGNNPFQGNANTAGLRHPEEYASDLIEDGNDEDGAPAGWGGLNAQDIADAILNDVNKEFVEASIRTWRDDLHGPGQTCLLDTLDRLAIGEPMWVQDYAWEVGPQGWLATFGLTGGGLPQDYVSPPV